MKKLLIRDELPNDTAAIDALVVAAFADAVHSSQTEHFIVRALRHSGQLTLALVADEGGRISGHVAVSPVSIADGTSGWYGLGPVAVLPARQRQGLGSALITRALDELRRRGAGGCVVLGDPRYYARFGFRGEACLQLPGVPAEYFGAIRFSGAMPVGEVAYHESFAARS